MHTNTKDELRQAVNRLEVGDWFTCLVGGHPQRMEVHKLHGIPERMVGVWSVRGQGFSHDVSKSSNKIISVG